MSVVCTNTGCVDVPLGIPVNPQARGKVQHQEEKGADSEPLEN